MRRPVATATQSISLFPFLAVLLCTMGALIVVLVVLNRQSRLQASALSPAEQELRRVQAEEAQADTELRRETAAWRLQHLRVSRDKTQTDLDGERLRLSGVEEHRRQLEARLTQLQSAAAQIDDPHPATSDTRALEELAKLGSELELARAQLVEAKERAFNHAPAYTVVPYDGPNRTRRRPIYIECSKDRVVIQPEGIVLSAADFDGPTGPGNPLASAVRAARDHLVTAASDPKSPDAEPYPLFLVRPDGIEAYYAARSAMQSWGSDFGYQTVDQDWDLAYPAVDSRLAELERQAVEEARQRLRWLAQMSPDRYGAGTERRGAGGKVTYRVSPMGGLVREGRPTLRETAGSFAGSGDDARASFGARSKRRLPAEPVSTETGSTGGASTGTNREPSSAGKGFGKEPHATGDTEASEARSPAAQQVEQRYGDLNDRAASRDAPQSSNPFDTQGSAHTDPDTGQSEVSAKLEPKPKPKPRSMAELRGVNWGLSPAARASNPITRPIHIVCEGDKLLVRPERPGDPPVVLPLRLQTEDSVDPLVAAVQERIKDWGIAGRGLYWRPQLILEVGHSGEGRYGDLEALLADSGFDVKRK